MNRRPFYIKTITFSHLLDEEQMVRALEEGDERASVILKESYAVFFDPDGPYEIAWTSEKVKDNMTQYYLDIKPRD